MATSSARSRPEGPGSTSHWDANWERNVKSAWTANPRVQRAVNRRMTGNPERHWLNWFFEEYLDTKPDHVLSVGCGDGAHELIIARNGYAGHVTGFDASGAGVAAANRIASDEGLNATFFVSLFEEFAANKPSAEYDLILFSGSLHHMTDLEGVLFATRAALKPAGRVLVNEYVGPIYQLYPPQQLEIINLILGLTPSEYKVSDDAQVGLPTIEAIYATDPSEGVRAPLIRALLPLFFKPEFEREMGGGLLHGLFGALNSARLNGGDQMSLDFVDNLIALEEYLTRVGVLQNDFYFGCYRHTTA